jgi:hypothetical protein
MDFYIVYFLAVDVACCVGSFVCYEAGVAFAGELFGDDAAC